LGQNLTVVRLLSLNFALWFCEQCDLGPTFEDILTQNSLRTCIRTNGQTDIIPYTNTASTVQD